MVRRRPFFGLLGKAKLYCPPDDHLTTSTGIPSVDKKTGQASLAGHFA
jgi:hypothetical protein